jgi:hypothetical protein
MGPGEWGGESETETPKLPQELPFPSGGRKGGGSGGEASLLGSTRGALGRAGTSSTSLARVRTGPGRVDNGPEDPEEFNKFMLPKRRFLGPSWRF